MHYVYVNETKVENFIHSVFEFISTNMVFLSTVISCSIIKRSILTILIFNGGIISLGHVAP